MITKSKGKLNPLSSCLAVLSLAAAVLFILPQFSRTVLNGAPLNINGFKLAFGFKDTVEVPGRIYVLIPFLLGILNTGILFSHQFVKALKGKTAPIFLAVAFLAFVSVALLIIYFFSAKNIDAGSSVIHNYYFKNIAESSNKDVLRGGFTFWFWLGAVCHLLCLIGCCGCAVRRK